MIEHIILALLINLVPTVPGRTASGPANATIREAEGNKSEKIFIGNYGEVLRFPSGLGVEAELRDGIEVIRFHDTKLDPYDLARSTIPDTLWLSRRAPAPQEYAVENFTPKRLLEMLVIPKSVPGYGSLKALRQAKAQELTRSGCQFQMRDLKNFPKDSFLTRITKPYALSQIYSQSDKHFFILTTGDYPCRIVNQTPICEPGYFITQPVSDALESYLTSFRDKLAIDPLEMFHQRLFYYIWLGANAFWLLLAFLPGRRKWLARIKLIGRATFIFSNALAAFAWLIMYASVRWEINRWCNYASADFAAAALMPWICLAVSAADGGRRLSRVFWWAMLVSIPLLFFTGQGAVYLYRFPEELKSDMFLAIAIMHLLLGFIYGLCFGLTHAESHDDGGAISLVLLLCLIPFLPAAAHSTTIIAYPTYKGVKIPIKIGAMADTPAVVAWKALAIDGKKSPEELHKVAESDLKNAGMIPKFRRVEVTGVIATAHDDTAADDYLFDKRIKFSSLNQVRAAPWYLRVPARISDGLHDITNTGKSENGETTPYIKQLFSDLKGAWVDEIVAHSAGAEAVYAAILNGVIYPPKKLIIIGVPDKNKEKWRLLQQWTGIDLHVIGFEADRMRAGGEFIKDALKSITKKPPPDDPEALVEIWL